MTFPRVLVVSQIFHCIGLAWPPVGYRLAFADSTIIRCEIDHGLFEGRRCIADERNEDLNLSQRDDQPGG